VGAVPTEVWMKQPMLPAGAAQQASGVIAATSLFTRSGLSYFLAEKAFFDDKFAATMRARVQTAEAAKDTGAGGLLLLAGAALLALKYLK